LNSATIIGWLLSFIMEAAKNATPRTTRRTQIVMVIALPRGAALTTAAMSNLLN
jgi:hypothetical protein